MKVFSNLKKQVEKLPEFSESTYSIVGYVLAAIMTMTGGFLIYEVLTTDALTFKAQWNMFKSPLGSLCWFIGFIWAMLWWGKFTHWSMTPVVETRDRYGNLVKREENYDITEQLFYKVLMPFLGHFVIEPIIYGAIIYYPIQCVIAVVGAIFPYLLSLIILVIIVGSWGFTRYVHIRYRSVLLVLCGLVFSVAFSLGGYTISKSDPNSPISMLASGLGGSEENPQPIVFDEYEIEDGGNYMITIDIPHGNGEREKNVTKGIREIIAQSKLGKEVGKPSEGTLDEVMEDYHERYNKYAEEYVKQPDTPHAPMCELTIKSCFQNEACVTFFVFDGIYFMGSPDYYQSIVRLSDGHVVSQQELVNISISDAKKLIEKYYKDDIMPVYLEDGYWFSPSSGDSCRVVWAVYRNGWGETTIPLSEMEPYLTEEGMKLFSAKVLANVSISEALGITSVDSNDNNEVIDTEKELEEDFYDDPNAGLLGSLPVGTTKYAGEMAGFPIEFTIHKGEGYDVRAEYLNVKYSTTMQLGGESLPAMGGDISFFGSDGSNNWTFDLTGDAENISGVAKSGDGKELKVTLHRK